MAYVFQNQSGIIHGSTRMASSSGVEGHTETSIITFDERTGIPITWNKSCVSCSTMKRKCDGLRPCRLEKKISRNMEYHVTNPRVHEARPFKLAVSDILNDVTCPDERYLVTSSNGFSLQDNSRCLEKNEGFNCTYQKRKTHKPHKPHKPHKRRLSTSTANVGSSSDMIPDTCNVGIPLAVQNEGSHAGLVSPCYSRFEGSHNPDRVMEAHVRPVMPVDISPEDWLHVAEAMLDPNIR